MNRNHDGTSLVELGALVEREPDEGVESGLLEAP